jgi:hypothetical protein
VEAALDLVRLEPIEAVEFHYGQYCPLGARCAAGRRPQGFVVVHLRAGPDRVIIVRLGTGGTVLARDAPMPATPST